MSLLGGYFYPTQRNSALLKCKLYREGLLRNPCLRPWIGYLTGGCDPICIFNKNKVSLYAGAGVFSIIQFLFSHNISLFDQKKTKY